MLKKMLFLVAVAISSQAIAQSSAVTSAWNYMKYGELDKAKASIDGASTNESTKNDAKTFLYKGEIYEKIVLSKKPEVLALDPNALNVAIESYQKCLDLDLKKKYADIAISGEVNNTIGLQGLSGIASSTGVNAYNKQDYKTALTGFESYISIGESIAKYLNRAVLDTVTYQYAGNAAYFLKDYPKANYYLGTKMVDQFKSKDANVYLILSEVSKAEKDTNKALDYLNKGMVNAKEKKNILIDRVNIYTKRGDNKQAIQDGLKAIEADPKNISIYLAVGTMYQIMKMDKEAEEIYTKALAIDPNNFSTNYLIGIGFYNQGANVYNESIESKNDKKTIALENRAKIIWSKALPYMKKAYSINPSDKDNTTYLSEIFAKLGDLDAASTVKKGSYVQDSEKNVKIPTEAEATYAEPKSTKPMNSGGSKPSSIPSPKPKPAPKKK